MRGAIERVSSVLRLTRVTSAVAIVGNLWFVVLWTRALPEEAGTPEVLTRPLWLLLPAAAFAGVSLFAFAATLNDILDRKRDRALRPSRPIAAGAMPVDQAAILVAVTLCAAVLGAAVFGIASVVLTVALAAAIMFFNTTARFIPAIGFLTLGVIYSGHMLVPNPNLAFIVPLIVVMTHALAVAATTHFVARKVPRVTRRAGVLAVLGWGLWVVLLVALGASRIGQTMADELEPAGVLGNPWPGWVDRGVVAWPLTAAIAFVLVAIWKYRQIGGGPRAAEKIQRYGSLWLTIYGVAWLAGIGAMSYAAIVAALAVLGFVGMTTLREVYGLLEEPVGYRR